MFRALALLLTVVSTAWGLYSEQVVVAYNGESELSRSTAELYVRLRGIPEKQVVALKGLGKSLGGVSREVYNDRVVRPLLAAATMGDWSWPAGPQLGSRRVEALVLMPDIPLRVAAPKPKAGEKPLARQNKAGAALDSELMLLGAGNYPTAGMLANPYYGKEAMLGALKLPVLSVCRIDGPDEASIRRMVEEPIRVERQGGLQGWVVVDEGGPHKEGDEWMRSIVKTAREAGNPVFHETSKACLSAAFPLMDKTAVYLGWYSPAVNGPFKADSPGDFRFAPGAVAVHIFSWSANNIKSADSWVGALLARGAVVTAGNVDEPYLGPTLHLDIFYDRLLKGYTVGEAALMASPVTSWQCIVLGDPLYRPFPVTKKVRRGIFGDWKQLYRQSKGDCYVLRTILPAYAKSASRFELAEMAAWQHTDAGEFNAAYNLFAAACNGHTSLRDRTRTAILAATVLAADGQKQRALDLLRPWLDAPGDSPYRAAIQASLDAIEGPKKK